MKAQIITIGNELLIGDTVNTNASWIGRFLTEHGFQVTEVRTISDQYEAILESIDRGLRTADLVVTTGGLGPTHDDVTKKVVADLFSSRMVLNHEVLEFVQSIFKKRGLIFSESNREQAMVPEKCDVLFNKKGTAPGMWFERNGTGLAVLPGVPFEMMYLMESKVSEKINEFFPEQEFRAVRYIKTAGVAESTLSDDVIGDLSEFLGNGNGIAFLPGPEGVTIRLSNAGRTKHEAERQLKPALEHIYQRAENVIYGDGRDVTLSEVLGKILNQKNLKLSTAESCTGGLLSNQITDIPGSSNYFTGGLIAYSNELKIQDLNVSPEVIADHGAVSGETALQMARGIAEKFKTDIGISTTGIAGPGGGTKEKPVGLVWVGFWLPHSQFTLNVQFTKDRITNKERTVMVVLETVRRQLLGIESFPYDLTPVYH